MAHEVETMMYVGKEPWLGLGVWIPEDKRLSVHEALLAAKLDWEVELRHLRGKESASLIITAPAEPRTTECSELWDAITPPCRTERP